MLPPFAAQHTDRGGVQPATLRAPARYIAWESAHRRCVESRGSIAPGIACVQVWIDFARCASERARRGSL